MPADRRHRNLGLAGVCAVVVGLTVGAACGYFIFTLIAAAQVIDGGLALHFVLLGAGVVGGFALSWLGVDLVRRARRRLRALRGACPRCAYDASGLSGMRCPECGAPLAAAGGR